jgi:DNA-directed RNA polymerase specialized sigma24 family protein
LPYRAALERRVECDANELRWVAAVILGGEQQVEKCLLDAIQLADSAGYVAPEWLNHWTQRVVVRTAVDRIRSEIQRIAGNYTYGPEVRAMVRGFDKTDSMVLRSMGAETIARSCNALERVALILYGYLGYSAQDCALLLECRRSVIESACSNALRNIIDNSHGGGG